MPVVRGYSNYRGRTPLWKKIVAVILLLVILAATAVTVLLQQHVVYDDAGQAHFVWNAEKEKPALPAVDPDSLTITVEEAAGTNPDAPVSVQPLQATEVAAAPLTEGVTLPEGAVVLTMKNAGGKLFWHSAAGAASSQTDRTTTAALTALLEGDRYAVARVACLQDPMAARRDVEGMGLKNTGGFIFYDGNDANWLDPSKDGTREYLCALAAELADMGFDELLLTDFSYPTVGKLNKIDCGEALKNAALAECLQTLRDALGDRPVKLTLELPEQTVLDGSDPAAGLVLTELAPLVDRIAVEVQTADAALLREKVQSASPETDFLPEVRDASGLTGSWLVK